MGLLQVWENDVYTTSGWVYSFRKGHDDVETRLGVKLTGITMTNCYKHCLDLHDTQSFLS